jgi:hypothetical protein
MANTILTIDTITKEALKILHEQLVFTNKIDKQYDGSFAKSGAKIGSQLRIRKPAQFTTRSGKTYAGQDFEETQITLSVDKQLGIDVTFSDLDLALDLNSFSDQFIRPAMSQLATSIEAETLNMILQSGNSVYNATGLVYKDTLKARKKVFQSLAPAGKWCCILDPNTGVELIDELKGLFQDSTQISKQYREGLMGRTSGFDFYESNIMPTITNPSDVTATMTVVDGASTVALVGMGLTEVIPAGFRFSVAGAKKVHPETKKAYADLYEFVTTADATTDGAGAVTVSVPPVYGTTAKQNISAIPSGGSAIVVNGAVDEVIRNSVAFEKTAFTMASADLAVPKGTDMASRQVMDGMSLRFIRDFDIADGDWKNRFDFLFGYRTLRQDFACVLQEPDV